MWAGAFEGHGMHLECRCLVDGGDTRAPKQHHPANVVRGRKAGDMAQHRTCREDDDRKHEHGLRRVHFRHTIRDSIRDSIAGPGGVG